MSSCSSLEMMTCKSIGSSSRPPTPRATRSLSLTAGRLPRWEESGTSQHIATEFNKILNKPVFSSSWNLNLNNKAEQLILFRYIPGSYYSVHDSNFFLPNHKLRKLIKEIQCSLRRIVCTAYFYSTIQ